ncbi:MAG: hypothetical protein GXP58_04100 [Deltaproteobacteria bacterium]|nr:hypothetical protein [Deltaproteobacteria bacterium]
MKKLSVVVSLLFSFLVLLAGTTLAADAAKGKPAGESGVVATVDGLAIHDWEVIQAIDSTPLQAYADQLNSSGQGRRVKQAFLTNLINQRLLYLEAKSEGLDQSEKFRTRLKAWEIQTLADLYTRDFYNRRSKITDAEVEAAWKKEKNTKHGANKLDAEMRRVMRNKLAARRFDEVRKELAESLGKTLRVEVKDADIALNDDDKRQPGQVIATVAGEPVTWRWARPRLKNKKSTGERRAELLAMGVEILKARKARGLGLDRDPTYRHRHDDFVRDLTAAQLVTKLRKKYIPTDKAFAEYYKEHPKDFTIPERRRLQQIVVKTRAEAKALRKQILKETTEDYDPFYKLAQERSIDPSAGRTSGVLGWITKGRGKILPELEKAAFALKVKEVSRPVKSPLGWHLIRTLERVAPEQLSLKRINNSDKREHYNEFFFKKNMGPYLAELRKKHKVVIDPDWFGRVTLPTAKRGKALPPASSGGQK